MLYFACCNDITIKEGVRECDKPREWWPSIFAVADNNKQVQMWQRWHYKKIYKSLRCYHIIITTFKWKSTSKGTHLQIRELKSKTKFAFYSKNCRKALHTKNFACIICFITSETQHICFESCIQTDSIQGVTDNTLILFFDKIIVVPTTKSSSPRYKIIFYYTTW